MDPLTLGLLGLGAYLISRGDRFTYRKKMELGEHTLTEPHHLNPMC